jgi:two-component system, NtrC family, response regulator
MTRPTFLIVQHDPAIRARLQSAFGDRYALVFTDSRRKAVALVKEMEPDAVIVDLALAAGVAGSDDGLGAIEEIIRAAPTTPVVVMGSSDTAETRRTVHPRVAAYLSKPLDLIECEMVLKRLAHPCDAADNGGPQGGLARSSAGLEKIIGATPGMRGVFSMVLSVANTDATVLVQGESGTGKELLARALHDESRRRAAPFVPINCGAIPDGLLEAELFGHEKGAFTGAHVQRKGKLELADTGTVFLDEIGEMNASLQVKLLRFLQEREIERIGGRNLIRINTRVIAASNRDLKVEAAAGRLREDLYFRLSVVTIVLPPLRERGEDIGMLANEFLHRNCRKYRRNLQFSSAALDAILHHPWPGNIRELENAVERAVILTRGRLVEPSDLGIASPAPERLSLREARNRVERQIVVETLTRTRGNISRAALELGISRPTMHDLIHKHELTGKGIGRQWRPAVHSAGVHPTAGEER